MTLHFKSLRSGSNGNCLMVWTAGTRILVDCGWESSRACHRALATVPAGAPATIDAVLVTHLHGDHIGPSALRVLADLGVAVCCHEKLAAQLGWAGSDVRLLPFGKKSLQIGGLSITPIPVGHTPGVLTHAFVIESVLHRRRLVIATDLVDGKELPEHLVDADFVFLEANHDPALARLFPVPNGRWHLANEQVASLLGEALRRSRRRPEAIMLGHLSAQRNRPELALACVEEELRRQMAENPLPPVWIAPRRGESVTISLEQAGAAAGPVQLSLF